MESVTLNLYITGPDAVNQRAIDTIKQLIATHFPNEGHLNIIDVLQQPDEAARADIFATPTLIRVAPAPERRVFGSMKNVNALRTSLDL